MATASPRFISLLLSIFFLTASSPAQTPEQHTSNYLESIRKSPPLLEAFLREMPKGGDLHNHLIGAIYAEIYLQCAISDKLCIDQKQLTFAQPPCDESRNTVPAERVTTDPTLYRLMIGVLSMRDFVP